MTEFASRPPSQTTPPLGNLFRGGLMPAAPSDRAALIIIDIRSLNIGAEAGREIEGEIREFIADRLKKYADTSELSAFDLSDSVFGFAVEASGKSGLAESS